MARVPFPAPFPPGPTNRVAGRAGRTARRLITLVVMLLVGLVPAVQAHAAPSVEEIEKQIDQQWEQLEPTIEQYNKVRSELKKNQKKAEDLQKKIQPLTLQTELALARVGTLATRHYKAGPSSNLNALLTTGTAGGLADQLTLLDMLARQEQREIASVVAVRDRFAAQKAKLDSLIAQQRKQQADLAAKKKHIDAEVKRLQAMLPYTTVKAVGCPTIKGTFSTKASIAIKAACAQVGDPYVWGANGPDSFDCSGLLQYAWAKAGVYLTHHTGDQWTEGRRISASERRPGDSIFFFSDLHHVGMYLGDGLMVHASRAGKPVQVASIAYMPVAGYVRPG